MIGAILGNIIGSPCEFDRGNKSKDVNQKENISSSKQKSHYREIHDIPTQRYVFC